MEAIIVEPAAITAFLEKVLDDGGMRDVEPEVRQQMLKDLRVRMENAIFGMIVTKLPEQDLPKLDQMIEAKESQLAIQRFLRERISNLDEVTAQAMLDFRSHYVKEAAK